MGVLVLDYVSEEKGGAARDEYRFKLNVAMGQLDEAAHDAAELARFEQVGDRVCLCLCLCYRLDDTVCMDHGFLLL